MGTNREMFSISDSSLIRSGFGLKVNDGECFLAARALNNYRDLLIFTRFACLSSFRRKPHRAKVNRPGILFRDRINP
ncbi:hypothetical protein DKP76_15100 [Falsochrobactrum shanghaiense]|uniref:Uncharacterized protein n=1 Tax=Falsochrobactrum shanghaiense TaxID=2201899 RepID=A0A316J644_9HYPH|nr:hypothetical protein DKP76_15100 [Falsochrobactrum shanghaiense]